MSWKVTGHNVNDITDDDDYYINDENNDNDDNNYNDDEDATLAKDELDKFRSTSHKKKTFTSLRVVKNLDSKLATNFLRVLKERHSSESHLGWVGFC